VVQEDDVRVEQERLACLAWGGHDGSVGGRAGSGRVRFAS
jgi:hypothetical protein